MIWTFSTIPLFFFFFIYFIIIIIFSWLRYRNIFYYYIFFIIYNILWKNFIIYIIFPSNIINNKKPVIIRNNTFEDKLNSDSDISFIEEITDLLKNVDEKKKNIIDKNILNENISNNIEKSNSIKPDLYQFKNLSSESRPFTSYGNVDVRKNNLKKKNEILK